jgi:hypothetical protein
LTVRSIARISSIWSHPVISAAFIGINGKVSLPKQKCGSLASLRQPGSRREPWMLKPETAQNLAEMSL